MEDIARMANVSKATVSRVINNNPQGVGQETRERVQRIIEETEYNPNLLARGISTSKSKTLGLVIPDITNPFFPELVKAVEECAYKNGYTVFLCNTDNSIEKEEASIEQFITKRVDGVILTSAGKVAGKVHNRLKKYNMPCVLLDRELQGIDYAAAVYTDNTFAVYSATEHLIKRGHSKIAYISGGDIVSTAKHRFNGYFDALKQYALPYSKDLTLFGSFTLESGYELTKQILIKNPQVTAILLGSDIMAIGAMKAIREMKKSIPKDVAVVGFDNIQICTALESALTTVQQPIYEMGEKAASVLIQIINGSVFEQNIFRIQPRLIIRDSS